METILELIFCHLVGDYVLQSDFIAKTKGDNPYHLIVHCVLYCLPFYLFFGLTWHLVIIFWAHFHIDMFKAHFKAINYATDQTLHYLIMAIYLIH